MSLFFRFLADYRVQLNCPSLELHDHAFPPIVEFSKFRAFQWRFCKFVTSFSNSGVFRTLLIVLTIEDSRVVVSWLMSTVVNTCSTMADNWLAFPASHTVYCSPSGRWNALLFVQPYFIYAAAEAAFAAAEACSASIFVIASVCCRLESTNLSVQP